MWAFLTVACLSPSASNPQLSFETGEVAQCLAKKEPGICYQAAVENPSHPKLDYLLQPACRAQLRDSCRRRYDHAVSTSDSEAASTALMLGCETGDDYLCAKYLEEAAATADEDQRAWIIDFVQESRRKHTEAKR
jgi:hypothetical protein